MAKSDAVQTLERDLRGIFGTRLQSLVIYGERERAGHAHHQHGHDTPPTTTMAVVESMTQDDLRSAAGRVAAWHDAGLGTPLLIAAREFERSLDAFPLEFGAILADHAVVSGSNPFASLKVDATGLRCDDLRQRAAGLEGKQLEEGVRFVLVEFLTVLGNLTADMLTPALHAELSRVAPTDGGPAPEPPSATRGNKKKNKTGKGAKR